MESPTKQFLKASHFFFQNGELALQVACGFGDASIVELLILNVSI